MKTYHPKKDEIQQKWWLVNADGQILGRLATEVAVLLRARTNLSLHRMWIAEILWWSLMLTR